MNMGLREVNTNPQQTSAVMVNISRVRKSEKGYVNVSGSRSEHASETVANGEECSKRASTRNRRKDKSKRITGTRLFYPSNHSFTPSLVDSHQLKT